MTPDARIEAMKRQLAKCQDCTTALESESLAIRERNAMRLVTALQSTLVNAVVIQRHILTPEPPPRQEPPSAYKVPVLTTKDIQQELDARKPPGDRL